MIQRDFVNFFLFLSLLGTTLYLYVQKFRSRLVNKTWSSRLLPIDFNCFNDDDEPTLHPNLYAVINNEYIDSLKI